MVGKRDVRRYEGPPVDHDEMILAKLLVLRHRLWALRWPLLVVIGCSLLVAFCAFA